MEPRHHVRAGRWGPSLRAVARGNGVPRYKNNASTECAGLRPTPAPSPTPSGPLLIPPPPCPLLTPSCRFITTFVTMFAIVIAITKDLPDVDGDRANGIETFATKLGVKNVSLISE